METQYASQLMGIILSWDYWDIESKLAQGEGPIAHLPTIPKHFSTPEVRWRVARMWSLCDTLVGKRELQPCSLQAECLLMVAGSSNRRT